MRRFPMLIFIFLLAACAEAEPGAPSPEEQARREQETRRLQGVCSAPKTYARLNELLLDEAVRQRGGDAAGLDRRMGEASLGLIDPITATGDPRGVVVCSGRFLVELPGDQAEEPRRLSADVEYAAQAANDGTGLVFEMEGADAIVRELAALDGPPLRPAAAPPSAEAPFDGHQRAQRSEGPSFDCAYARLPSERMICDSRPLSALDRQMASLYYDQLERSGERERRLMRRTRDGFLARRDRCRDAGCIASVYEDRIAEIRRIGAR